MQSGSRAVSMMRSPLVCHADPGLSSSSSDFKLKLWTSMPLVNSEKERVSVVMLFVPKHEADIGPLRSLVSPQNPPLFKRIGTEKSGMTKVYPNSANANIVPAYEPQRLNSSGSDDETATVLTVWKKSLLLNCNGFTVFDSKGNLVFRVDNYLAGHKGEIVLMDATGKPLLTIRRKRLSLGDNWVVYDGETTENPRFCATKHVNILKNKCLAHVTSANSRKGSDASKNYDNKNAVFYQMEGSYAQRCCAVYDSKRRRVAEIKRKEAVGGVALGVDVFSLIVQPDMDTSVAMSLVILLDQMYGTSRR